MATHISSSANFLEKLPEGVLRFCKSEKIVDYLETVENLIRMHFPEVNEVQYSVESDPEVDERYLVISAKVSGDVDDVVERYDRYVAELVEKVPWPQRDKIVFSYDIT